MNPALLWAKAQCQPAQPAVAANAAAGDLSLPGPPTVSAVTGADNRALKLLASGGLAGAISRTVTAPIDRLKFLMQVNSTSRMTVREGLARMASEKSAKAYFRGNGANVLKNVPETALKLTFNDRIKALVLGDGHHLTGLSVWERLLIGGLSGAAAQTLIYPLEVVQTRLAATHLRYNGIAHAFTQIYAQEGRRALFRGWTPCMLGIIPYAGIDISLFELTKERLQDTRQGPVPGHLLLLAGMFSSSVGQMVAYPLGFVRTRLQMDGFGGAPRQYRSMFHCFSQVLATEGFLGLYKGFGMALAKIAPASAISWFIFEETKLYLHCPDVRGH